MKESSRSERSNIHFFYSIKAKINRTWFDFESSKISNMFLDEFISSRDYFRFVDTKTIHCTCSVFFNYLWCKHTLATLISLNDSSVLYGLEELLGPHSRGRPSKRGKALDKI